MDWYYLELNILNTFGIISKLGEVGGTFDNSWFPLNNLGILHNWNNTTINLAA